MSELDYVSQTLTRVISVLATHPGGIAERMKRAYAELHPITVDKLPDDLKGDWVHIEVELGIGEGDVPARIDIRGNRPKPNRYPNSEFCGSG